MAGAVPEASSETGLREIAEQLTTEFRKSMAAAWGAKHTDADAPQFWIPVQEDAFYDLLSRGVIEAGPGAFQ